MGAQNPAQPTGAQLAEVRRRNAERATLITAALGSPPEPIWCPVVNVARERAAGPGGAEVRRGTRLFAPGAKVCVFPHLWDSHSVEAKLMVVGRHRASHRLTQTVIAAR